MKTYLQIERVLAYCIDIVIYAALTWILQIVLLSVGSIEGVSVLKITVVISVLVSWLVPSIMEGYGGKTFGKMALGIGVASTRFYKINVPIASFRNFLKIVLMPVSIPFFFLSTNGFIIHDYLSGTEVISK